MIEECPFFTINWNLLEEPYLSSGYGLDFENAAKSLQKSLVFGGYNGNTLPGFLQSATAVTQDICEQLSLYGQDGGCSINTNFNDVKKSQFNSFIAYLRFRFEKLKQLCNSAVDGRWNQECKKICLRYNFDFLNNVFSFDCDISDSNLIDSFKVEEVFSVETFSGTIYYEFYVKQDVNSGLSEELEQKITETHLVTTEFNEVLSKTRE